MPPPVRRHRSVIANEIAAIACVNALYMHVHTHNPVRTRSLVLPRRPLAHDGFHLRGKQRRRWQRSGTVPAGRYAIDEEGQVTAPDPGIDILRIIGSGGQHEDHEREVGTLEVGPGLPGSLRSLHECPYQWGELLARVTGALPGVG